MAKSRKELEILTKNGQKIRMEISPGDYDHFWAIISKKKKLQFFCHFCSILDSQNWNLTFGLMRLFSGF